MAFKEAFGGDVSPGFLRLALKLGPRCPFLFVCLLVFSDAPLCPLIDETRQTLRGYGLYKVDFNAFGCRAPGGLEEEKKNKITLPFPDLVHQAAVGVTFSYAEKTTTHTKKKNPSSA